MMDHMGTWGNSVQGVWGTGGICHGPMGNGGTVGMGHMGNRGTGGMGYKGMGNGYRCMGDRGDGSHGHMGQ